ncbi:MAG: sugar ABC transporter permease [Marinisporobacter sp.]|jgi:multiple sugar transport system permease protein|nr:sugar ABC transporter permease [Marinisporobacter sp.]
MYESDEIDMKKKTQLTVFLVTPSVMIIFGVLVFPILYSIFISMHEIHFAPKSYDFVGFKNYIDMFSDSYLKNSVILTVMFAIITVGFQIVLGVMTALVLNEDFKGRGLVRGIIILPWALPTVVNAVMWKWIFNADYGIFNALMMKLNLIEQYQVWLGRPLSAFICIAVANIWKETPYVVLLTIAALSNIPKVLYEAAKIDGASSWKVFWNITFPLIKPVVLIIAITQTIWAFKSFDLSYIVTFGGPSGSTEFLPLYIHKNSFKFQKFGYGAAMSYMLSMLSFGLTYLYIKIFMAKKKV